MIKKIILLLAIVGPFGLYFFYSWLLKLENKKIPVIKLTITSVILLLLALISYSPDDPNFIIDQNIFVKKNKFKGKVGIFEINDKKISHILNFYMVEDNNFKKIF